MASHTTVNRERPCPLLVSHAATDIPAIPHLKKALEDANVDTKIDALKKTILLILSGEPATQLIMPIIRFVLPHKDRTIKKLLLLYWEVVDKKAADGKLLHEMILVWYVHCEPSIRFAWAIFQLFPAEQLALDPKHGCHERFKEDRTSPSIHKHTLMLGVLCCFLGPVKYAEDLFYLFICAIFLLI